MKQMSDNCMFTLFMSLVLASIFFLPMTYGEPVVNLKDKDCSQILTLLGEKMGKDGKNELGRILALPDDQLPDFVVEKDESILFNFENVLYLANHAALMDCIK